MLGFLNRFRRGESAGASGVQAGFGAVARFGAVVSGPADCGIFPPETTADQAADSLLADSAALVVDLAGDVCYSSPAAQALGLVVAGRVRLPELAALLDAVRHDGQRRVRQFQVTITAAAGAGQTAAAVTDRGTVAGGGATADFGTAVGRGAALDLDTALDLDDDVATASGSTVGHGFDHGLGHELDGQTGVDPCDPGLDTRQPAGSPGPERWLRVTAQLVGGSRVLARVDDRTEERRFQQQRRDFVTNVAHELKTPTGAIGLLAETIANATDDPQAVAYFAGRVGVEAARLSALVAQLIELERVESGGGFEGPGQAVDFDAGQLVAATVEEVRQDLAVQRQVGLSVSVQGAGPLAAAGSGVKPVTGAAAELGAGLLVRGQADLLHAAVRNLVENAVNYSPAGSDVRVVARRQGKRVVIRVLDQGIGIPVEAQTRIFERFYRVDAARQVSTGGSGIGLSIVKHAVERLGGRVSVWSKPGEGSTFTVELPAAPMTEGAAEAVASGSSTGGPGL